MLNARKQLQILKLAMTYNKYLFMFNQKRYHHETNELF